MKTVQIWLADVRRLEGREEALIHLLTPNRREAALRASREDRFHSLGAGLLLRDVLGITEDADVRIGGHGKPELVSGQPHFNLSHGGHYAVLAVSDVPVGVDVEHVSDTLSVPVPRRWLKDDELAWLEEERTPERFARLWTRLESALKADGSGLAMENRTFSVLEGGSPWHLRTFLRDGHVISCAAAEDFAVQWNEWVPTV